MSWLLPKFIANLLKTPAPQQPVVPSSPEIKQETAKTSAPQQPVVPSSPEIKQETAKTPAPQQPMVPSSPEIKQETANNFDPQNALVPSPVVNNDSKIENSEKPFEYSINVFSNDKTNQQKLKDYILDYKQVPQDSIEKTLFRELIIAFFILHPSAKQFQIADQVFELKGQANDLKALQSAYLKQYGVVPRDVQSILKNLQSDQTASNVHDNLLALKRILTPFDVLELERLIKKTEDARKQIENKDFLFIIGTTGSGKSTNILKFLGYTLKNYTFKGLPTLVPVQKLAEPHKTFHTSPQTKSCTRNINAAPIPQHFYKNGTRKDEQTLVICDSPGLGDIAGVQVDIANGVGMINALLEARSVRMVVLLAHDALTAQRFKGAIDIGNTISSLFHDFTKVLDSIAIYFNKVPKDQINVVPHLIKDKMETLEYIEKADQKLDAFLKHLLKKSQSEENFIYPLESDYKKLFESLHKMPAITQVEANFRYDFTLSTKREITSFITNSKIKIKDYINTQRLQKARFHLQMLHKLKNIIYDDCKISEGFTEMANFIKTQISKYFKTFQQNLIDICKGEENEKIACSLASSKKKVQCLEDYFKEFEQISPIGKQQINKVIEEYKQRLLGESKTLESFNSQKQFFIAVKKFSQLLDPKLENIVVDSINKQFNQAFKKVQELLGEQNYLDMAEHIKTLKSTSGFIHQFSPQHSSQKMMDDLKLKLITEVDQHLLFISERILQESLPITARTVEMVKNRLKKIQTIDTLKIVEEQGCITRKLNECIKKIILKCKMGIRELDKIDISIASGGNSPVIDKDYLKDLASKKNQIELLMKISNVGETLQQDYEFTKENIGRRLTENVEILNNCIGALRENKTSQIERDLSLIKRAAQMVRKCSQCVEQGENYKQLADSISGQFLNYLNVEMQTFKGIEVGLGQINQQNSQSIKKIQRQYKKNQTYTKMGSLGLDTQIEQKVTKLKQQFMKILTYPLTQFIGKDLDRLQQKIDYQRLGRSLQNFQKLCYYSLQIQQIISSQDRSQFVKHAKPIKLCMEKYLKQIIQQVNHFLKQQLAKNQQCLKELIKILVAISGKRSTCIYLSRKMDFEVTSEIEKIKQHLFEIKCTIESKFSQYNQSANRMAELTRLMQICRFYAPFERELKIKEQVQRINFNQLGQKIHRCLYQNLKDDLDRAISLIKGSLPSKILWYDVKNIYLQFDQMNTAEGKRKKSVVTQELAIVQRNILQNLKSLDNRITSDPDIVKVKATMNDLLQKFQEALQIKRQLESMYIQEDKKLIQTTNRLLKDVGTNMIEIFKNQFGTVQKQLTDYNINSIKQNINHFGGLQYIINSVFLQEDHEPSQEHKANAENARQFIDTKRVLLKQKIKKCETIEQFEKNDIDSSKSVSLKKLFNILSNGLIQEIQKKYDNYTDDFVIDKGFKKYYSNFLHPREAANIEHKNHLGKNVYYYFNRLFDNYKSADSQIKRNGAEKQITDSIEDLPPDLKQMVNQQYQKFKSYIKNEKDQMSKEYSQKIWLNPIQTDNYLAITVKASKNGQKDVYTRFTENLNSVYEEKSRGLTTITEKTAFINDYFIKVLERNKEILKNNPDLDERISLKLDQQLKRLLNLVQTQLLKIKKLIENPARVQQEQNDILQSVKDVFQAYQFIIDQGKDHSEVKGKLRSCIEQKLIQVIQIYNQKVANQPQENLSSIQILDKQKTKKLTSFIEYLIKTSQLIEAIRNEFQKASLVQNMQNFNKEIVERYMKVKGHSEIIVFYQSQVKNMLQYAKNFDFYDQRKRNMTIQHLQVEMLSIKHTVDILKQKMQFFNKYILNQNEGYDFNTISQGFPIRLKRFVMESKAQIEDAFKNLGGDPIIKINLLLNVLRIMKEKKLKLIENNELEQNYNELLMLLKSHFEKMKQQCTKKIKEAHDKKIEVQERIILQQMSKKLEIGTVQRQIQESIRTLTEEITKRFDQRIAASNDERTKNDYENGKKMEISSTKNELTRQKQQRIKKIQDKYNDIINKLNQSLSQPLNELAQSLALYKKVVLNINYDNQKTVAQFQAVLDQIPKDPKFIKMIEHKLDTLPNDQFSLGRLLLTTNPVFSNFVTRQMAKLIKGKDIEYVLDNIEQIGLKGREAMPKKTKDTIRKLYQQFRNSYEQFKTLYNKNPQESTISLIVTQCKDLGTRLKLNFYQNDRPITGNKIKLLSGIFAIWAIQKSQKIEEQVQYTMEPHPTQITTLIVLIGMAHKGQKLANRLAQVGTGEGKSIVLAGLSSYLALCGFKVRCACYSAYLSGRDQSNFRQLFEKLGIENDIKYGTFNQFCEDTLNQSGIIFKREVQKMVIEQPQASWQKIASQIGSNLLSNNRGVDKSKQKPTILVIDEVDIFFDERFFGNTYCPGIKLTDPILAKFLEYVWTEVTKLGDSIQPAALIASQEFRQLIDRYPSLSKLLENQVHGMVVGALSYKHDYFLIDKKLVYKDNDTISSNISYGYKTVFANIFEHYRGNVSRQNLDEALQISLMVAELSYAMLPNYFQNILGVTGTLEILPEYKKKLLKERYKIEDQYAIPSAFGVNNRRIDNYQIVPSGSFYQNIIANINKIQDKRPILIFFKQARDLNEFAQSPWYDSYLKRTYNLTQQHEPVVRTSRINGAVNPDTITLMTNSFGRGTDFNLLDNNIKEKGGLHVIHAFLSHDESEEIQIKGRTARQSNPGSYDCIINENSLQELGLSTAHFPNDANTENIHSILLKARQVKINNLSQSTLKFLQDSDQRHQNVVNIFAKNGLSQRDLIEYVQRLNLYPEMTKLNIKAVLGLDATGSMEGALKKTCEVIGTAFQRAYLVLAEEKVRASFEIKIMIYRNYNSPFQEILETTAFENTPHNLHKFLERVGPKGGWGNEAIEVFFQSLNKEEKIDMAMIIGDAAPNSSSDATNKRARMGENYWNSNGYPATNMEKELEKFVLKKCPVHSFYLNDGQGFIDISKNTGGEAAPFKLSSSNVADELTKFVVEKVVHLIGEKSGKGGMKLVQTYRRMFT